MDAEAPLITHEFYVTLANGHRGTVAIDVTSDGEIRSVINGKLLELFDRTRPQTAVSIPSTRMSGIRRVENADGSITPVPSEKVKTDIRLFVDSTPCWFPECEALRAAYNAELASLPTDCPACEKGALIRKYLKRLETINTDPS
jgi:hypothetical protein